MQIFFTDCSFPQRLSLSYDHLNSWYDHLNSWIHSVKESIQVTLSHDAIERESAKRLFGYIYGTPSSLESSTYSPPHDYS
jgi:hypothetical protein